LLAQGLQFEVSVSTFEETLDKSSFASAAGAASIDCFFHSRATSRDALFTSPDYARETALHKAIEVAQRRLGDGQLADLVIGADTIVEAGGQILEKPRDERNATQMLSSLSGTRHAVHTGVALIFPRSVDSGLGVSPLVVSFAETTHVQFADLTPETIAAYIATGEPFGKAGAYGIQGVASSFVQSVTGCYFNVVGFPLHRFSSELVQRLQAGVLS